MKVLISSGGTEQPVDGIRSLTNTSTGKTGLAISQYFSDQGADVTLLRHKRTLAAPPEIVQYFFNTYDDLYQSLKRLLESEYFDAVIHLAAVSDYRVVSIEADGHPFPVGGPGKIESSRELVIRLEPTEKIIRKLKDWSLNKQSIVFGFKLTQSADSAEIHRRIGQLFDGGGVDYVVHNDTVNISDEIHHAELWSPAGMLKHSETKGELAENLYEICVGDGQ